jgi:hypothetical protein
MLFLSFLLGCGPLGLEGGERRRGGTLVTTLAWRVIVYVL